MRVLLASTAGSGHFGPLVPVAHACRSAGHEVAVAAPESFAAQVAGAGLEHLAFADAPSVVLAPVLARLPSLSTEEANRTVLADVFGRLDAQVALPGVTAIIQEWGPDLVVREPIEFGSLAAALAAGVPHAVVAVNVSALMDRVSAVVAQPLAELDEIAGIALGSCSAALRTATTFTSVPRILDDARPLIIGYGGPLHRYRAPAGTGDRELPPPWGDPADPLVYVSFGSVASTLPHVAGVYQAVLGALADEPLRVLLTTGDGLDPHALSAPGNACVRRWWPQAAVLPEASAVVGHGGFGTTLAALAAGVPQVLLPLFAMDQFVNAEQVAAVGAGVRLLGGADAAVGVPAALGTVLGEPRYAAAAQAVADEIAALPPVTEVVRALEELAG
ncbi:glycosyltransferase [Nocardioides pantholopis]|uniref:glycosyltransferase n=1 Tax=Nocardioides pantholopis TaxID=2483798 RepID=UPI000F088A7D|nr:glycosyltransferase [Nocardioides pantholopis]